MLLHVTEFFLLLKNKTKTQYKSKNKLQPSKVKTPKKTKVNKKVKQIKKKQSEQRQKKQKKTGENSRFRKQPAKTITSETTETGSLMIQVNSVLHKYFFIRNTWLHSS